MFVREFQKFFTRDISLAVIEYWFTGEYVELRKILNNATHFNPLFISHGGGVVHVYYDINNPDTAVQPLFDIAKQQPDIILVYAEKFTKEQEYLKKLLDIPGDEHIREMFETISRAWGYLPLWVQLGGTDSAVVSARISDVAYRMRDEFQYIEYRVGDKLLEMIRTRYPHIAEYADMVLISECLSNSLPDQTILRERKEKGFVYFEGVIYPISELDMVAETQKFTCIEDLAVLGDPTTFGVSEEVVEHNATLELSGKSAYTGVVRGLVVIVSNIHDLDRVIHGSILVTTMTHPEYVPAMKRAGAFVTDEGGITCHAAIVARELKIPCIVGTRIATKKLKDGDMVEVDANTGIIRCISK